MDEFLLERDFVDHLIYLLRLFVLSTVTVTQQKTINHEHLSTRHERCALFNL